MSFSDSTLERGATRDDARALFGQTMGLVAVTAALFAVGAYLGRNMSSGAGFLWFIGAFVCLLGLNVAIRRSEQLAIGLLFAFGVLIGLGTAPTIAYYAATNPQAVWQAGGATALFIAGFGAAGYATRRDLQPLARFFFWALLALIVFGIVTIFVRIPNGSLDLRRARPRRLRRVHDDRLPAAAEVEGHQGRAAARRIDLPRHPQRLPLLPLDLRPAQLAAADRGDDVHARARLHSGVSRDARVRST